MKTRESLDGIRNSINLEKIEKIYIGADRGCRCGCKGNYYYPSDKGFKRALNRMGRLTLEEVEDVELNTNNYTNFSLSNNKAITLYYF